MKLTFFSPPFTPADEALRQQAVDESGLVRDGSDATLDAIVAAAAALFGTSTAALSVVDEERQCFVARAGFDRPETTRAASFCGHAILAPGDTMMVEDATADARFAGNPLVTGAMQLRFYAGVPVRGAGGQPLGALCVFDTAPRSGTQPLAALAALAAQAEAHIAARTCSTAETDPDPIAVDATATAPDGNVRGRYRDTG